MCAKCVIQNVWVPVFLVLAQYPTARGDISSKHMSATKKVATGCIVSPAVAKT